MEQARRELGREHGGLPAYRFFFDRLEAQISEGSERYLFDAQAWYGGDIDKLWLKAEGHGTFGGEFEGAELQALWSHAIGPWFDLQTGLRYDAGPREDRAHLVVGAQGLAPYWIEIDAAAFLSDEGDLTARVEAEHDVRITQSLILQPRAEIDFSLRDIPAESIGSGVVSAALGLRLRYQVTQLFAPYLGVEYETSLGSTRDFRRADDGDVDGVSIIAGIRTWF
jgi:copper resistance protein B